MSAFMCSNAHINALVSFALQERGFFRHKQLDGNSAQIAGQVLVNANAESIKAKYNEEEGYPFVFRRESPARHPLNILKACDCYDYQACEDGEYEGSEAQKFIDHIRAMAIRRLPGYDISEGWQFEDHLDTPNP